MESLKALSITQRVLEFIVLDAQPMSVVEDDGFCRLLEYLEPSYCLPSRTYFFETGIQFIINSTMVSDRYRVSTDTQSPGIGIGIGTEKVVLMLPYLKHSYNTNKYMVKIRVSLLSLEGEIILYSNVTV